MPIKEIVQYGLGIAIVVGLAGNPLHFRENLRNFQFQILKECSRVDNWGNPSPFPQRRLSANSDHRHQKVLKIN